MDSQVIDVLYKSDIKLKKVLGGRVACDLAKRMNKVRLVRVGI